MRIEMTFALACLIATAPLAFASNTDGTTTDLSAQQTIQQQQQQKKGKPAPRRTNTTVHRNTTVNRNVNVNRNVHINRTVNTKTRSVTTAPTSNKTNLTTTRTRTITTTNKPPRQVTFRANRQTFTGTRARTWHNSGQWNFRGRNYSYWRHGPWRHRYGNSWRTYVALSTLAAIAVGTATYYPYAYLDVPQDYCDGITEDGCQMSWAEVETLEGGVAPACVTYCPWQ